MLSASLWGGMIFPLGRQPTSIADRCVFVCLLAFRWLLHCSLKGFIVIIDYKCKKYTDYLVMSHLVLSIETFYNDKITKNAFSKDM